MTIHYVCRKSFVDLMDAVLVRAEMDESVFQVIETTGQDWGLVRKSVDPAMSKQNAAVQGVMREFLECECPIVREERRRR